MNLPIFHYKSIMIDPDNLRYNPCHDIIFPSVIKAADYFEKPLGRYYMYYAPHNPPGGICMAYSDALEGPWIEYKVNPLIKNVWLPYYKVSHVSSPHAIWIENEDKLFLYYHGENDTTRFASSIDGIHFSYEGVAVTSDMFENITGASYARVFRYSIPSKNNLYIMTLMGNNKPTCRIYLAWSRDGRTWETRRMPFINPPPDTGVIHNCAAWHFPFHGKNYFIFHGDSQSYMTDLHIVEFGLDLKKENHIGKFLDRLGISLDNERISDPCIIKEGDKWYLFCSIGKRLNQKIALAVASENHE